MKTFLTMRGVAFAGLVLSSVAALSIASYAADAVRLRGTIASFEGTNLVVKTREGDTKTVALADGWTVSSVAKADAASIKAGDYVGIASAPAGGGVEGALEVLIFPAAMKGTGEGSFPWDLKPDSTMTNATVADIVTSVDGRSVKVSYPGGDKTIDIPANTPIVTTAPATKADLVAGAAVVVFGQAGADGAITGHGVVVGTNGVVPPM